MSVINGSYNITNFTYSGSGQNATNFTIPSGVTSLDVLLLAGGGSGGLSGGGGAGGMREILGLSVTPGNTFTLIIGNGSNLLGNPGMNTSFYIPTTAAYYEVWGGGSGGNHSAPHNGLPGGSGGGGAFANTRGGGFSMNSLYGNAGGSGATGSWADGGGGGGAGGVGQSAPAEGQNSGDGGMCKKTTISGFDTWLAAGGGAGSEGGKPIGVSPAGCGNISGNGASNGDVGGSALNNTGSGGGGSGDTPTIGGRGSSGLIIIRYLSGDNTPPNSITGLTDTKVSCSEIQWNWTNPTDTDYAYLYTLKNNNWVANYTNSTIGVSWIGLTAGTQYNFSSRTVDLSKNMNATWVNRSETTDACPTPTPIPYVAPIIGDLYGFLSACNGITWVLPIPATAQYNGTMVYRNNTYLYNVTNTTASEMWTGLGQGVPYTISTKPFYKNGTINSTWTNASSQTALCGCSFCGLTTTIVPVSTIPYLPAETTGNWIKDLVMQNAWWLILLIGAILILRRK